MTDHAFVDVVLPIVTFLVGVISGGLAQKRQDSLAGRSEPKRDAAGKRDPTGSDETETCRVCGKVFAAIYLDQGPKITICDSCCEKKTFPNRSKDPVEGFEPPVWSRTATPLHEYKACQYSRFCEACGAGQFHAVHASPSATNKELWERIQRGEGARKQ